MNPLKAGRNIFKLCAILFFYGSAGSGWTQPSPAADLDIMQDTYPVSFYFRDPEHVYGREKIRYDEWSREMKVLDGIVCKIFHEERPDISGQMSALMNRYAKENPRKLVMLHYNGDGIDVENFMLEPFSPGHFLYYKGCPAEGRISEKDTELRVSDLSLFMTEIRQQYGDDLLLVERDSEGKWLWDTAEFVYLKKKSAAYGPGTLTVERGRHNTAPRSFKNAWVAPHVSQGPWGPQSRPMWNFNYSTLCVPDNNGKTAGQVLAEVIGGWFKEGGPCENFHGIQLDIASWEPIRHTWGKGARAIDINYDGVADNGIIDGVNVYALGVYDFYKELRQRLGESRLFVADGGVRDAQRAVPLLNGMEAEGFCRWNDWPQRDWSSAINRFVYWRKNSRSPHFSYITAKDYGPNQTKAERMRLTFAIGFSLGLPVNTFVRPGPIDTTRFPGIPLWDEITCGTDNQFHWLGKPVGPIRQMAEDTPDLLNGAGEQINRLFSEKWESDQSLSVADNALVLSGEVPAGESMRMQLPGIKIDTMDLIVFCKVKASQVKHYPAGVPRVVNVRLKGADTYIHPETDGKIQKNNWDHQMAYAGPNNYADACFYFRGPGANTVDLEVEAEESGTVWVKELTVHQAVPAFYREFEHGIVLGNPSHHSSFEFDLNQTFPGCRFRRINGRYEPEVNNGKMAADKIILGPLDGLFLVKVADKPDTALQQ